MHIKKSVNLVIDIRKMIFITSTLFLVNDYIFFIIFKFIALFLPDFVLHFKNDATFYS